MPLYLGFDCSTQGMSAVVIDVADGQRRVVFQDELNFDRDLPAYGTSNGVRRGRDPREVRSSPLMWAEALDRMMEMVSASPDVDADGIRAIAGSAQQHGSVYLADSAAGMWATLDPDRALAPQIDGSFARSDSPVWMDESTTAQCRAIEAALGGPEAVAALTGSRAFERFTGPQIRKFAEDDPAGYARTARIHLVSSYLASLLAGVEAPIEPGDGAGMNLMDLASLQWSPQALDATAPGLRGRLPPMAASWTIVGSLSSYWQRRHGFSPARVVAWSGDNPCSLVGTGAIGEGSLAISLGTSDTVFAATRELRPGASHIFGSPAGGYMNLVCFRNGSLARERVRDEQGLDWTGFSRALDATPPGNGGALMLPWFEPEITPHVAASGVRRFDLDASDSARNVRAVVEAQMMAMANHAAPFSGSRVDRIVATGGASANRAILQVMADVFGAVVAPQAVGNAACLGAALRAFHADRVAGGDGIEWTDVVRGFTDPVPGTEVVPVPAHVAMYAELRKRYAAAEAAAAPISARRT